MSLSNPANPISPLNPANPASPVNPNNEPKSYHTETTHPHATHTQKITGGVCLGIIVVVVLITLIKAVIDR